MRLHRAGALLLALGVATVDDHTLRDASLEARVDLRAVSAVTNAMLAERTYLGNCTVCAAEGHVDLLLRTR